MDGINCTSATNTNNFRVSKSRRMGWAGHVALWGEERCIPGFFFVET